MKNHLFFVFSILFLLFLKDISIVLSYKNINEQQYANYLVDIIQYRSRSTVDHMKNLEESLSQTFSPPQSGLSTAISSIGLIASVFTVVPALGPVFGAAGVGLKILDQIENGGGLAYVTSSLLTVIDESLTGPDYYDLVKEIEDLIQSDIKDALEQHDLEILSRELFGIKSIVSDFQLRIERNSSKFDIQIAAQSAYAAFEENYYIFQMGTYSIPHFTLYIQSFLILLEDLKHNGIKYGFSEPTVAIFSEKRSSIVKDAISYIDKTRREAENLIKKTSDADEYNALAELHNFYKVYSYDFVNNWFGYDTVRFPRGILTENARVTLSPITGNKPTATLYQINQQLDSYKPEDYKGSVTGIVSQCLDGFNSFNYLKSTRRDFRTGRLTTTFEVGNFELQNIVQTHTKINTDLSSKKIKSVKTAQGATSGSYIAISENDSDFTYIGGITPSHPKILSFNSLVLADIFPIDINSLVFAFVNNDITSDNEIVLGMATQVDAQKYHYKPIREGYSSYDHYISDGISFGRGGVLFGGFLYTKITYKIDFNPPISSITNKQEPAQFKVLAILRIDSSDSTYMKVSSFRESPTYTCGVSESFYVAPSSELCGQLNPCRALDEYNIVTLFDSITIQPGSTFFRLESNEIVYLNSLIFVSL